MILKNVQPRIELAMKKADESKEKVEIPLMYQELLTYDTIISVFEFIFKQSYDFTTRHDEFRFVIIIHPKNN